MSILEKIQGYDKDAVITRQFKTACLIKWTNRGIGGDKPPLVWGYFCVDDKIHSSAPYKEVEATWIKYYGNCQPILLCSDKIP